MDSVSRSLEREDMEHGTTETDVTDLKTRLGDLQIDAGGDTLIDDIDLVDEKQDVAIITPDDSMEEAEPLADDFEGMKARIQISQADLEIEYDEVFTWNITEYRQLSHRQRGPKFECGGHPWRVLLFPRGNNVDHVSMYLEQGREENEKAPEGWYACVQFTLVMWNPNDPSIYKTQSANHRFNAEEADWGFTRFAEIRKLFNPSWEGKGRPMVENEAVNISAYIRIYKDPTGVLWHNFINYNSKKETGMVGLKNQGATCYLNSLLQSLYFTNAFRKAIYQIPTEDDADKRNSAWALQRLFYCLQSNEEAVSTSELTTSFGWETRHIFEQQDVQELSRILMDRMEERMKGTDAENALPRMFVGKMKTYISCINVDYESSRVEDFWDIQLNVSGNKCLDDSFRDYVQVETMDGENKYFAEGYGLQDAKKGVIFESFPQVLHLQLKRFEYDVNRDAMMKVNDRYEFPEVFDAAPYLSESADKSESYTYQLHGVLVHSGDFNAGHYYAFLKPTADGHFYKFDDDKVTRATMKEALEENFGGDYANMANGAAGFRNPYTRTLSTKRSMSAYMLVYIRQSRVQSILQDVSDTDSPLHLKKQLDEERAVQARKLKDREEAHLYLHVNVVDDDNFKAYQGFDLAEWSATTNTPEEPFAPKAYKLLKTSTVTDFVKQLAEERMLPPEQYRLWAMVNRQNKTIRPDQPIMEGNETMDTLYGRFGTRERPFRLWLERAEPSEDAMNSWPEWAGTNGNNTKILVFLKYFDVDAQSLMGVGHLYMHKNTRVSELVPHIFSKMGWSTQKRSLSTPPRSSSPRRSPVPQVNGNSTMPSSSSTSTDPPQISLYEEIKSNMIEPMKPKSTLQAAEIQDGDIICFQKHVTDAQTLSLTNAGLAPDAQKFYDTLLHRVIINFYPKFPSQNSEQEGNENFSLVLSKKMTYDQVAAKVGEHLRAEPSHLRLATVSSATGRVKQQFKRTMHQSLWQLLRPYPNSYSNSGQRDDSLIYEVLEMTVTEMESKKTLKVTLLSEGITKEESFDVLVPKTGTILDVLRALQKKSGLSDEAMQRLRLFEVQANRILRELEEKLSLLSVSESAQLYAEVEDPEIAEMGEMDRIGHACHFDREVGKGHGVPFRFVLKDAERFSETKERLSKRTGIKGKLFEKIKFHVIGKSRFAQPSPIEDDDILIDRLSDNELLGLDHVNKTRVGAGKGDSIFIR